jgi:hypothetical protein
MSGASLVRAALVYDRKSSTIIHGVLQLRFMTSYQTRHALNSSLARP